MNTFQSPIINSDDWVLVTGSNGFIGTYVVQRLLEHGYTNVKCFVRPTSDIRTLTRLKTENPSANIRILEGNLLSKEDCRRAADNVSVIFHLAAGVEKTFAGAFMNSVVATRNLLDVLKNSSKFIRFVNVSSFSVYSNANLKRRDLLDESCDLENDPVSRHEPYCFGKLKQEEIVREYTTKYGLNTVQVRPGAVYGPGKNQITGRVGIDTFGFFMHLGLSNQIPFIYVENCAEAIVLAGIIPGVDGEYFNLVDDELPSSKDFLKAYRDNVTRLPAIPVAYPIFYFFSFVWEKYSIISKGQLAPVFNRKRCMANWKGNRYDNRKLKSGLGWKPIVSTTDGMKNYFNYCKQNLSGVKVDT